MPTRRAAIGLGSNLGNRAANLIAALAGLNEGPETELLDSSSFHEFAAVRVGDAEPGGAYLNAAALIEMSLEPLALLARLHEIEQRLGRDRATMPHGAPRIIDLDVLLFEHERVQHEQLQVPHPRLSERLFVLKPLAEIAPGWRVPLDGRSTTVRELLSDIIAATGNRS